MPPYLLVTGLSAQQRRARLAKVAEAIAHPAIPEAERHHLYIHILHHGHWQGNHKCTGDRRYCATCLQETGDRHEEHAIHVSHDCATARAVWAAVADTWESATTEPLDVNDPTLTVLGLRPQPPDGALGRGRAKYYAREPAWRLLHAVTLRCTTSPHPGPHGVPRPKRPARAPPG